MGFFVNKFERIYENSPNRVAIIVKSVIFKVHNGGLFRQNPFKAGNPYSECCPGVRKHCVKFDENSSNIMEAVAMSDFKSP